MGLNGNRKEISLNPKIRFGTGKRYFGTIPLHRNDWYSSHAPLFFKR